MFLRKIYLYFGRMWLTGKSMVWAVWLLMAEGVLAQDHAAVFGFGECRGKIANPEINEVSGLVAAMAQAGHFWTHNDSGDGARIFLIDDSARHRATYYLGGIRAHDWEDIAMMERNGRHYLLIGDIGDNRRQRPSVQLHMVAEPPIPLGPLTADTIPNGQVCSFTLVYEDGPRDAEALFFDPLDDRLYIVSKRELEVGLYAAVLPEAPLDTLTLRRVGNLPHTFVTSAAISPDGTEVVLKNLLQVFYWKRRPGESVPEMLSRSAMALAYQPEPQGEAITFAHHGAGYYTLSEAVLGIKPILYFYRRLQ